MANVHGFRDVNQRNQNNNRNNQPGNNFQNANLADEQIPFMNPMRSDRQPMDETIPFTLKLICCPDFKVCSTTFIYLISIWALYIVCLTQGIDKTNYEVLEVQKNVLINFGAAEGILIKNGEIYRLITASFLHVSLIHILMNSISLMFLCTRFQKTFPKQTPIVLLVSSISGFGLSVVCDMNTITVGASTSIFGILGGFIAYLIINWTALQRFGPLRSTIACIIGFIVFFSLLFSIDSSIDAIAHLGGLLGGILISLGILPGMQQKNKVMTYVGIGGICIMNLTTLLILFLSD